MRLKYEKVYAKNEQKNWNKNTTNERHEFEHFLFRATFISQHKEEEEEVENCYQNIVFVLIFSKYLHNISIFLLQFCNFVFELN